MGYLSILLTTEGTYPFYKGGVSTWCQTLTQNLPEMDFTLLALAANPYVQQQYKLSTNVRHLIKVPLWGIDEPAEYSWHLPFSIVLRNGWDTTDQAITSEFLPFFEQFLCAVMTNDRDMRQLGEALLGMHTYFQRYDYHKTMRAALVWKAFQHALRAAWQEKPSDLADPSLAELTEAMCLLYRFLLVLNCPVPPVDLTHSTAAAFCGLPCVIAKLQRGTPYLLTEHGVYLREQYLNLKGCIPSLFVRWFLYHLCGAVVSVNYYFADQISPVCKFNTRWEGWWGVPSERIKVIYNGVDPERFYPIETSRGARPIVANVGLIFPLKGQIDLIEAAALVRAQQPDVEVRLYGSASDEKYFARCQELVRTRHLENSVAFAGSTKEPWRVYSEADVTAFASISEGFPYVVIEAMLSGAGIVSTDVGGISEALGDTGLLVRPHRPAELAQAIVFLLQRPALRKYMGFRARARALQFFTQDRCLNEYRESYQKLFFGRNGECPEDRGYQSAQTPNSTGKFLVSSDC